MNVENDEKPTDFDQYPPAGEGPAAGTTVPHEPAVDMTHDGKPAAGDFAAYPTPDSDTDLYTTVGQDDLAGADES